ncbi:glycosyltransferase family 1 protein [Paenibacillus sp. LHD-117]|uniref:glycosyltransferase family 4 protein n=1 Tax=Paenibacillus sp. LHD-117 TaxID=3071412 RepID=UPI0027DEFDDA|nr:glycosyltransferase family 1 protein [Paenibacillus sp. LHD-117]MDQ6420367.1 glycosyltransferase family 1 protein [Paenibacillus sp. LHD-117]
MKVAIFTDTYAPEINGVARTLGRWTDYLERQGVHCKVFAPEPSAASQQGAHAMSPVERFASLPFFLYPECRLALPNPSFIRKALRDFQPDLIHVATPFNLGLCGIHYARKYGIPLVASYHTNFDHYLSFYNLQWMEKLLWRYMEWFHRDCQSIFVPSATTLRALGDRGWDESRMKLWTRGVDAAAYHPGVDREEHLIRHGLGDCSFMALYVGRLAPEKNVEIAIEAFAKLQQANPNAAFVIAGDGPSAPALKERCKRDGIRAVFVGFAELPELQRWYAAADVLLFPSPTETFGNVVLESMACGTPVIGANAGGVRDTVRHGETGLLCEPGSAESFASALSILQGNMELRERMGRNAHAYSLTQSWDGIFGRLLGEYTLIKSHNRQSNGDVRAKNAGNG